MSHHTKDLWDADEGPPAENPCPHCGGEAGDYVGTQYEGYHPECHEYERSKS